MAERSHDNKDEHNFQGTVWAFQIIAKEGSCPRTVKTVFLSKNSDILDATSEMAEDIWQNLVDYGYEVSVDPPPAREILTFLNWINDRSCSRYVVRIYPPTEDNLQEGIK